MLRRLLAALAAAALLTACNGVTMSGPSTSAGYAEQTMASGGAAPDFGLGSGAWAASGLAGGEIR